MVIKLGLKMKSNTITFWKDGTYKIWGGMDDQYAKSDKDYKCSLPLNRPIGKFNGRDVYLTDNKDSRLELTIEEIKALSEPYINQLEINEEFKDDIEGLRNNYL